MSTEQVIGFIAAAVCLSCAIYIAIGRSLFRMAIALFGEFCALSVVFLSLNAEYLAAMALGVAVLGAAVIVVFSAFIKGNLHRPLPEASRDSGHLIRQFVGVLVGLGMGAIVGTALLARHLFNYEALIANAPKPEDASGVRELGVALFSEHQVLFALVALFILTVVVGSGLLLRRPNDAD